MGNYSNKLDHNYFPISISEFNQEMKDLVEATDKAQALHSSNASDFTFKNGRLDTGDHFRKKDVDGNWKDISYQEAVSLFIERRKFYHSLVPAIAPQRTDFQLDNQRVMALEAQELSNQIYACGIALLKPGRFLASPQSLQHYCPEVKYEKGDLNLGSVDTNFYNGLNTKYSQSINSDEAFAPVENLYNTDETNPQGQLANLYYALTLKMQIDMIPNLSFPTRDQNAKDLIEGVLQSLADTQKHSPKPAMKNLVALHEIHTHLAFNRDWSQAQDALKNLDAPELKPMRDLFSNIDKFYANKTSDDPKVIKQILDDIMKNYEATFALIKSDHQFREFDKDFKLIIEKLLLLILFDVFPQISGDLQAHPKKDNIRDPKNPKTERFFKYNSTPCNNFKGLGNGKTCS